jgi:hypothetical protein
MPFLSKAGSLSGTKPLRICPLPWLAVIVGDYCNDGTLLIVLANGCLDRATPCSCEFDCKRNPASCHGLRSVLRPLIGECAVNPFLSGWPYACSLHRSARFWTLSNLKHLVPDDSWPVSRASRGTAEKSAWQLAGCCHFVCSLPAVRCGRATRDHGRTGLPQAHRLRSAAG